MITIMIDIHSIEVHINTFILSLILLGEYTVMGFWTGLRGQPVLR